MTRFRHETQPNQPPVTSDALRRNQLALEAMIAAAGASGVTTFMGRAGVVSLLLADVMTALGITLSGNGGKALVINDAGTAIVPATGKMPISIIDLPTATPSKPLIRWEIPEPMTFAGGIGNAGVAATAISVLRFFKNGVQVGTASFTGTTGTIAMTASYSAGDIFELYPPTSIDATLDQVSITLETT
jgi:hypothetical protein